MFRMVLVQVPDETGTVWMLRFVLGRNIVFTDYSKGVRGQGHEMAVAEGNPVLLRSGHFKQAGRNAVISVGILTGQVVNPYDITVICSKIREAYPGKRNG